MQLDSKQVFVLELIGHLMRSWWTLVAGVALGLSAALLVLAYSPKIFEARATLDSYAEDFPDGFVTTTVADDVELRLKAVQERVLTREDLPSVLERAGIKWDEPVASEDLATEIRANTQVYSDRRSRFFDIAHRDTDPRRASEVVNILAGLFVEENSDLRADLAGKATQVLEDLAAQTLHDLETREQAIEQYRREHFNETPDQYDANLRLLDDAERRLTANLEDRRKIRANMESLEAERYSGSTIPTGTGTAAGGESSASESSVPGSTLATLRAELDDLLLHYSAQHPDVLAKQREIDRFLEVSWRQQDSSVPDQVVEEKPPPGISVFEFPIRAAQRELDRLENEESKIRREIVDYNRRIQATPAVEARLEELSRDTAVIRGKYQEYLTKIETARGAERLEESQAGETFEVVSHASPPTKPVTPKPLETYGIGLVAGLLLFVTPVILRRVLSPPVSSEQGVRFLSEIPVLVTIPLISTPATGRLQRRRRMKNLGLSLISLGILVAVLVLFGFVDGKWGA